MRCNDLSLKQLLTLDEASSEFQTVAHHVEDCSRCQQRLVELSSDDDLQIEVRDTLRDCGETEPYHPSIGSVVISIEASGSDEISAECEPISLDFLAAPSHPEMLGRIGRYDVERMIGSGGMGIVLKGFDTELHRVVAIKVLKPHLAHIGAARHRFAREAQSAAAVVHEHVIPIYDVQSEGETPFLVMQYVPGQSLQSRVDERGPLEMKEVLRIARQMAAGLGAAHAQGLVHRDVKPANILLEESVERVLISDFGLARTVDDATLTRTGIVAGTPHYMSPEQASGHPVNHRSDLFSLGSVIYFMCTGRPPFRAEHAMAILNRICHDEHRAVDEVNSDVPAELAELVDQLLTKQPNDRFQTAQDVEQRLGLILSRAQTGHRSRPLRWRRGWQRWKSTVKLALIRLISAAACIAIGVGITHRMMSTEVLVQNANNGAGSGASAGSTHSTDPSNETSAVSSSSATSMDEFEQDLASLQAKLNELFGEQDRERSQLSQPRTIDDDWYRELEQTKAAIKSLEQ